MSPPAISVLLPVRDAAATLGEALDSVARQTETDFECVVVDDGSRDASAAIARRRAEGDARFRLLPRARDGLVAALRAGVEACRAPLIARMDADDRMRPRRLAAQRALLARSPDLAGVGCHVRVFPRRDLGEGLRRYEGWLRSVTTPRDVRREAFVECPLAHPTWCVRAEVLRRHPYREAGWPEDYDLLLRLLGKGQRLGVVPRRLHDWRDAPGRMWRTHAAYARERVTACKAAHLADGFLARADRYTLWGYGDTGRALARALREHGKCADAIVELHPGRLGQRIHGAPVVRPEAIPSLPPRPLVVSVAGAAARAEIRAALARMGLRECVDFVCAA